MSKRYTVGTAVLAAVGLSLGSQPAAGAQAPAATPKPVQQGASMSARAIGTFDVKATPIAAEAKGEGFGRVALDKQFRGDLEGTGKGEMLTASTSVEGSAGYVAIERVAGSLRGRKGTFLLLHQGTMQRGADFKLSIAVVPDSGTGQFAGLTGKLAIDIAADGTHSYDFEYSLPETP